MGVLEALTDEELQLTLESFVPADVDFDGFLTPSELPAFLVHHFPNLQGATMDRLRNILIAAVDRIQTGDDGSNKLDLREFLLIVRDDKIDALRNLLDIEHIGDEEYAQIRNIQARLASDEMDMFRDAFIKLDANGDGMLDIEELMAGVEAVLKERFPSMRAYLEKIFEVADKDQDGMLCLREFMSSFAEGPGAVPQEVILDCTAMVRLRLSDDEIANLQVAFREMDQNGDGYLDRAELKGGLKAELQADYPRHTDAQFDELVSIVLAAADNDRDGKLNISEFIRSFQEEQGVLPSSFMGRGGEYDNEDDEQNNNNNNNNSSVAKKSAPAAKGRLTKEQKEYLVQAFRNMDTNRDGFLDAQELESAVTNTVLAMMPERADEVETIQRVVFTILAVSDVDRDGKVDWNEFYNSFVLNTDIVEILEEVADVSHDGFKSRLTPHEVANLKQAFAALDSNHDGFVSRKELAQSVKRLVEESKMRHEVVQEIVDAIMGAADRDHDNKLTLREFVRAFASGQQVMDLTYAAAVAADIAKKSKNELTHDQVEALKEAFVVLDRNHDGYVDARELRAALFNLLKAQYKDENEVIELVSIIISAGDSDYDGKLSLTEFIRSFKQHVDVMSVPVAAADTITVARERILQALTDEEIEALRAAFEILDANHDGVIDEQEFANAVNYMVEKNVRREVVPEVVQIIMETADADRDHRVTFVEFLLAFAQQPEVMASTAFAAAAAKETERRAKRILTPQQIEVLKLQFSALDANQDGFVDQNELASAIFNIIGEDVPQREKFAADITAMILRAADSNQDGKLNISEFVVAFTNKQQDSVMGVVSEAAANAQRRAEKLGAMKGRLDKNEKDLLRQAFASLDTNRDGELDASELAIGIRAFLETTHRMPDQQVARIVIDIMDAADADRNGRLSLAEFVSAFDSAPEVLSNDIANVIANMNDQTPLERVKSIQHKLMQHEIDQLRRSFAVLDLNADGYLDAAELENAVRTVLDNKSLIPEEGIAEVVRAILHVADVQNKGKISVEEFLRAFEQVPQLMQITKQAADAVQAHARLVQQISKDEYENLRVAFNAIDKNHDGFVSRDELANAISHLVSKNVTNKQVVDQIVDLIMSTSATGKNGKVNLQDFVQNFIAHSEIVAAPLIAATAATATAQSQQKRDSNGVLVPAPPSSAPIQNNNNNAIVATTPSSTTGNSPGGNSTSAGRARSLRSSRPGATTKELLVEASPIVNDVSGVAINDEQLRLQFEQLDSDGSGRLSKPEFKRFYLELENFGLPMTDSQFENQWNRLCGPKESSLTFDRFALFMLRRSRM